MNFSSRLEFILSAVTHAKLWVLLGKLCLCLEHERNSAGEWLREGTFREERLGERALNHCRPTLCLFRCSPSHPASDKPVWANLLTPKHGFKIRPSPNNCYNKRNSGFFFPLTSSLIWSKLWKLTPFSRTLFRFEECSFKWNRIRTLYLHEFLGSLYNKHDLKMKWSVMSWTHAINHAGMGTTHTFDRSTSQTALIILENI